MAECGISPVGCLKDIGKGIITRCLWPHIKSHIDYWWCFDDNIQVLRDGVLDLDRETFDINQKIEEARFRTDKLRPGVEDWSKAGTKKLGEARIILQDDINPKAWNLISRYSMGKRAKKTAEEIAKHRNDGKFNAIADPAPPPAMGRTPHRSTMDFESRKRIEEDIIKYMKKSSVGMIGICGMGGVGKTTMARRIRERIMEENLFDEVVMVVVSQQIDMVKIQEEIADWLKLKFDERSMSARAYKLRTRLMDTKRKIIIFDDVWESLKLEDLGVPLEGCKILLTTRSKDVCEKMEAQEIIPMKILTKEEAWILFKEKAGNCVEDSTLFPVAEEVVEKCNGLPIALVTVGKALRDKKKSIWVDSLSQLSEANPADFPEVISDVYNPLKLSYNNLDNERERLLFLLCCLFPEDYDIPVEELTSYFMGLQKFDGSPRIEEARNRTDRLVEKLQSRFLLIEGKEKHHVKMHDVVRDVAIFIGSKVKNRFLKSLNQISIENLSDINCEWMSVDVSNEPMNVDMSLHFPKLHVLMLLGLNSDIYSKEVGDLNVSFEGITDLNVLSFSDISIGSLPPTLALLQNLRTLYLNNCKVGDISVIGKLGGLEILYFHYCYEIKELPAEIGRLIRLRLLELKECLDLQRIPFGILSSLVRLEELKILASFKGWEAEEIGKEKRNASIRELETLTNLTCLEIEISDSNLAAQEIRLSPKLVKYKINISSDYFWFKDRVDYEKVMFIKLASEIGAVGKWIQNLVKNTECLRLEGDGSNNINLEECQHLRNLEIRKCSTLKKVVKTKDCESGINVFPMLERLRLEFIDNLEEIWDGTIILNQNNVSSLSNLKYLNIERCSKLRYLFSVSVATTCLLQLEELRIEDCEAMEQVFRNEVTDGCIEFPKLKELRLRNLPNLTAFCQGIENIRFPNLTYMWIEELPKLNSFCGLNSETGNHDTNSFHFLCNPKVEIGGLKTLTVEGFNYNNIRNIWCHQIPINFFNNLEELYIYEINGIRSLMSYSIAKNLVSLKNLTIDGCSEMVEVIEGNDCQVEPFTLGSLNTPKLMELRLVNLPNLTSFCQGIENIKFPQLTRLLIGELPKLNSFCGLNSETVNHDPNTFHLLCNPKVEIGGLKTLVVQESFNYLQELNIYKINGIRSLMSYSIAKNLVNLQSLQICDCEELVEVIEGNDCQEEAFTLGSLNIPKLKTLRLDNLPNLTSFCQGIENIKFPQLTYLEIDRLPKLNSLLCNPKAEIGGLKTLDVWGSFNYNNIRNIWCHQIPINFFNILETLVISYINGIRSLMSYSIAKNLVSLKYLRILNCEEMVEVIEEGNIDDDKQVVDNKCLFPTLKTLEFQRLLKLRRFWQWNHALELPLLEEVRVINCPVMETFTLGSLNTPNLMMSVINRQAYDMKDLNDILHHHFNTKNQNTSTIKEEEDEDNEEENDDKDENNIEYNNENANKEEDECERK